MQKNDENPLEISYKFVISEQKLFKILLKFNKNLEVCTSHIQNIKKFRPISDRPKDPIISRT